MASKIGMSDEESFIVLGSSPTPSMEARFNGDLNGDMLKSEDFDEALKSFSNEASMALKAHFKYGDGPSTASMMAASTIVSEDVTTEELQKRFGEILDENVILKETLKQNNDSMKEQFLLIASCQEDMMKTHKMHKEKFDETKELIEKLRIENKKLKNDIGRLVVNSPTTDHQPNSQTPTESGDKSVDQSGNQSSKSEHSGPGSTIEFVTSPDDDMINKLTAQLALVEKQRRQVIVDNERLTWQKESLEHIVDVTSKERDELQSKIKTIELHHSSKEIEYKTEIESLNKIIKQLEDKVLNASISSEELRNRDVAVQQFEVKVATLQSELKSAQLRVLELESVKLEFSRQKSATSETVKMYRDQLEELHSRLKEAQTVMFQPVRFSISQESDASSAEYASLVSSVKLYDRTIRHIGELLNSVTNGTSETLLQTITALSALQDLKMERSSVESARNCLNNVKATMEKQHSAVLNNIGHIKGTLSIFEGIFKDHKELLKKCLTKTEPVVQPRSNSIQAELDALTAALLSRDDELQAARAELAKARAEIAERRRRERQEGERGDEVAAAKAQADAYRADFEAEREARQKMASDRENVLMELRNAQKRNQELTEQLDEVRKLNPNIYKTATTKRAKPQTLASVRPTGAAGTAATGNMVYTCPKCNSFSSEQYKVMEDHFDFCLDDF